MSRAQNRARRWSLAGDRARVGERPDVATTEGPPAAEGGLRYGFTLADLDKMTSAAVIADRSMAMPTSERREIAWSAIAEALYAAEHPPSRQDLIRAGWQAIYEYVRDAYRHHGYRNREAGSGNASAPMFAMYWLDKQVTPSHESRIVERYAIGPIVGALTELQQAVVHAVAAADGNKVLAAARLGLDEKAFAYQLRTARAICLSLWLEGETPRKVTLRRLDRRQDRGPEPEHGTSAAARRHRAARETACELCAPVLADQELAKRARRREREGAA